MKHLKKYENTESAGQSPNEYPSSSEASSTNGHLLIVWTESSDEIHFLVMELSHLEKISEIMDRPWSGRSMTHQNAQELVTYIISNSLEKDFYQSFVTEDYKFKKYNIQKVIHLPEMGM